MKIIVYKYPQNYNYITDKMEYTVLNNTYLREIWLWESYDVCTAGSEVEQKHNTHISYIKTNRGGNITYHNPGQRIIYFLITLSDKMIFRLFIEEMNIICCKSLNDLSIPVYFSWDPVGIWIDQKHKVGSCGFRIKHNTIYYGIAINITNNTTTFYAPCGLQNVYAKACNTINTSITIQQFDMLFIQYLATVIDNF